MQTKIIVAAALLLILASIFATESVFAQSNQVTTTVSLSHLNVQLTYPSQVLPSQLVTINLTAQAKDSFQLATLTVQVYLAEQNDLQQLLSTTVAQNTMMLSGDQINNQVQVTVPSDAPRTSLVAQVTESVGTTSYPYNTYAYPFPYQVWNWYYYRNGYFYSYGYPPSTTTSPIYYYSPYPSYYYQPTSDNAIAPLSYVLAPTPEYVTLQSQYQQLQTQNQQLRQQLQTLQNSTAQKDSTIRNLNNQLSILRGTTTLVEIVAVILAIAFVTVAGLHFKSSRTTDAESHLPAKTEEKTTGA